MISHFPPDAVLGTLTFPVEVSVIKIFSESRLPVTLSVLVLTKIYCRLLRGKTQYSQKGNSPYSPFFSIFFFFPQLCPYLFPSRSILFSLIISESVQSALAVWECNRVCERFLLFLSFSSFTVASALANLNALTPWKVLKLREIKGIEGKWNTGK